MSTANCLVPEYERKAEVRGLCKPCYSTAHSLVVTGRTTWEALEKQGKAVSSTVRRGQAASSKWFLKD